MEHPQTHTQQRVKRVTRKKLPMDYTNTGLYRFIYGLYQYMDYTNNERVKRVLYTIYQQMKRYNHFNTTIYHTGQKVQCKPTNKQPHNAPYHITIR